MKTNENRLQVENLIRLYRENDQQAFARLLQMYEPLVQSEVNRYTEGREWYDRDDFRQVAEITFSNAARSYDLSQSEVEFGLFAKICISNALCSYSVSVDRAMSRLVDLDPTFVPDESAQVDPGELIAAEEAAQLLLARIHKILSPYENRVWTLYMLGFSAKKIGSMLGKDPRSIENAVYRIRHKLREKLGDKR